MRRLRRTGLGAKAIEPQGPPQRFPQMGPGDLDWLPAADPPAAVRRLEPLSRVRRQFPAADQPIGQPAHSTPPSHHHSHQHPVNPGQGTETAGQQGALHSNPAKQPGQSVAPGDFDWAGSGVQWPPAAHRCPILLQPQRADQGEHPHRPLVVVLWGRLRLPGWLHPRLGSEGANGMVGPCLPAAARSRHAWPGEPVRNQRPRYRCSK